MSRGRGRGVDQQLALYSRRRRLELAVLADAVEAQDAVEVQRAAALELGDLHVGDPHAQPLLRDAAQPGELARELDRRPPPQLGRERVPEHGVLVVKALRADRLAQARVVLVVDLVARERDAVRADARRRAVAGTVEPCRRRRDASAPARSSAPSA